jgi:hypothetical protein
MIQVSAGQTLLDVCLQELGTLDALFDLADANGLSVSAPLRPGQWLTVPATVLSRPDVASYFAGRAQRINLADSILPGNLVQPDEPDEAQLYFESEFFNPQYFA